MINTRWIAAPALALVATLAGCNDSQKKAQSDLLDQNDELTKQLAEKDDKLNALGEQLARVQQQATDLQGQLEECNNRAAAPAPAEEAVAVADAKDFQGIEGVEATVQGDDIHLTIANSLLFDSGKTVLRDSAKKSLDKVSSTIKEKYGTREILVVGYTDSDPIRKSTFSTNYHLGFERAFAVRGYLDRKGVSGSHMGLMSFGPDRPAGSKEKSRRVEVIVTGNDAPAVASTEEPRNQPAAASKAKASTGSASSSGSSKAPGTPSQLRKASNGRTAGSASKN
jgi:outer membrane protein OmpA-like peptidoglycan-associated protein